MPVRHALAILAALSMAPQVAAEHFLSLAGNDEQPNLPGCLHGGGDFLAANQWHVLPIRPTGSSTWYFKADALLLDGTGPFRRPLAIATNSLDTRLESSRLDLDALAGPRLLLGHRLDVDRGWEFSYWGLFRDHRLSVDDPNNLDIAGTLRLVTEDYSGADQIAVSQSAMLHNAEANYVLNGSWSALAGCRYLNLDDEFVLMATDSDSGSSGYRIHTRNHLLGPQLGFRTGSLYGRWGWEVTAKAGFLACLTQQQQRLLDRDNTLVLRNRADHQATTAILEDLSLICFFHLNDAWSIRAGYYALYLSTTALATDQLDLDDVRLPHRSLLWNDLFAHGLVLGLEARW